VTLAKERPTTRVCGADKSEDALAVARENAHRIAATNTWFVESDLFENVPGPYELVTANPPYIATGEIPGLQADIKDFEPKLALDGGDDGLVIARKIVDQAPAHLVVGGVLALEVGAGQAQLVARLMEERGYDAVEIARDYGRIERVVSGIRGERTKPHGTGQAR
jgi:release factor glutamine methyltransferase